MTLLTLVGLVLVGVVAGMVNTLAGGGSLITLPVLVLAGLPPSVANGTNRVGVLLGSLVAGWKYRDAGLLEGGLAPSAWLPACVGALLGAWISVDLDEEVFRRVVGVAMLGMLVLVLVNPKGWLEGRARAAPAWGQALGFFAIGVYGGFLQAGVGIFLLAGFVLLSGHDLVGANARKVVMVALFTLPAMAVFVWSDAVWWGPGLALAAGSAVGGWLGARLTVAWGATVLRWVLAVVVCVSSGRLLGVW